MVLFNGKNKLNYPCQLTQCFTGDDMIPVTAAIIEKDGSILAARRGPNQHLAGFWEFPGGKVESGESHEECLRRELEEEFSVQCLVGTFVAESIYDYGDKVIQLFGYFVHHVTGSFRLTDHDKICWLPVEDLSILTWSPADIPIVEKLQCDSISEKNLQFYQENSRKYVAETSTFDMQALRQKFTDLLPPKAHILDLGCGSGRDSRAFLDLEFKVTAMDGSAEIAKAAKTYLGQEVKVELIQDLDAVETFDGIWACASLLHVTKSEMPRTFESIVGALIPHGIWYMSFKNGDEERWDEQGRFFNDYSAHSIRSLLNSLSNIEIIDISKQRSLLRGEVQNWLNVFIRKL